MCKLLACDLDGTLFYPRQINRCISRKNVKFLRKWIDLGNKVVLITSRSLEFVQKLKKEIQREFDVMTCSSAQIMCDGKMVKDTYMKNEELITIYAHN